MSQPINLRRLRQLTWLEVLLFLSLWFCYGVAINSGNLVAFGLQQAGIEAYVERHHFYLEGSKVESLKVQPVVDAFLYNGHIYPAKQPGQFMFGAVAYFPLHFLGLNYSNNYLLTAALVTFLTASFLTASGAVAIFRIVSLLQDFESLSWPLVCAVIYGVATTAFPYSGIAWHDSIATSFLIWDVYLVLELRRTEDEGLARKLSWLAGFFLGLTLLTSMLPFLVTVFIAIYFVSLRRWRLIPFLLCGGLIGLAPLLIYNFICFRNPFLLPNVAGSYRDTFFHLSLSNFLEKIRFYTHMLTVYVPVFWCGVVGLTLFPQRLRNEQLLIFGALLASMLYILNIDASGTCQYGPRYLLPAMPLSCLGLVGFSFVRRFSIRVLMLAVLATVSAISLSINLIGALQGAMLCDFPEFAAGIYLSQMVAGNTRSYPLAFPLLLPLLISTIFLIRQVSRRPSS